MTQPRTGTRRLVSACAALLLLSAACASPPPVDKRPPAVDAAEFTAHQRAFVRAYDELESSILATPLWALDERSRLLIQGQAKRAGYRAHALRPFAETGQISNGAVDLMQARIDELSALPREAPLLRRESFAESSELLDQGQAELAFSTLQPLLPQLQAYADDGLSSDWVEREAMPRWLGQGETLASYDQSWVSGWTSEDAPSARSFVSFREELATFLKSHAALQSR